jgi:hypothetical protein
MPDLMHFFSMLGHPFLPTNFYFISEFSAKLIAASDRFTITQFKASPMGTVKLTMYYKYV